MKTIASHRLVSLIVILAAIVPAAIAQTNVKAAFDAIINCRDANITEHHTLDKDPSSYIKTGQSDVYRFELPASRMNLVKNVISALGKDSEKAYSIQNGSSDGNVQVALAVGDGDNGSVNSVRITEPGYDYAYALFLAPKSEDPDGNHRYAYGVNYKKEGGKIKGTLLVTYATTLKYRQSQAQDSRKPRIIYGGQTVSVPSLSVIGAADNSSQPTWFSTMMSYFQIMTSANPQMRISFATKIYELIQDVSQYPEVTASEKDAVREILKEMISDNKYSDPILKTILNQSLVNLK